MNDTITITEQDHNHVRLELDGMKIHLLRETPGGRYRKPRVYTSGSAVDPDFDHPPYGSQRGDGSPEDKAWRRYNREEIRLQRALAARALEALKAHGLQTYGVIVGTVETKFSRKAGCSCGCSPGLILQADAHAWAPLFRSDARISDIWVEASR